MKDFLTIWGMVLLLNQVFIFGGCLAPHCLLAALPHTGLISWFLWGIVRDEPTKEKTENRNSEEIETISEITTRKANKFDLKYIDFQQETDPLKQKGDDYERAIGKQFENKGDVVVYHGLIKGYEDQGVDIIAISEASQRITLVQCKNWTHRPMKLADIEQVYAKLECYESDFMNIRPRIINAHSHQTYDEQRVSTLFSHISQNPQAYTIQKALYVSSDKVIDLNIGKSLRLIKPNIFRYENMKIVVYGG